MPNPRKTIPTSTLLKVLFAWPWWLGHAQTKPAVINIANAPVPINILVQSPADTETDLQVICLFSSSPVNTLHGALVEMNDKLHGLLDRVRNPILFRGELGETLLLAPPRNSLGARKLLIVGLGDSQTFSLERMQLAGEILYTEASRLGVMHPFFAPTILDGGITKFTTGEISEQVITGFLRAAKTEKYIKYANASASQSVAALTYLAGQQHANNTREGIEKAISTAPRK
jgi:hypothetical protein